MFSNEKAKYILQEIAIAIEQGTEYEIIESQCPVTGIPKMYAVAKGFSPEKSLEYLRERIDEL